MIPARRQYATSDVAEGGPCFDDLVDLVLPDGMGYLAMMAAYFDESGTHDGSPVMCVAGYLFPPTQAKKFSRKWSAVLEREGLPYFRKSECESGGGPFAKLSMDRRISLQTELIELIGSHMAFGSAAVMSQTEYDAHAPEGWHEFYGGVYTACLHLCMAQIVEWMGATNHPGSIAYFFESGHQKQHEASVRFENIGKSEKHKAAWRYASHTFADKRVARPCDAADYLAWHVRHYDR